MATEKETHVLYGGKVSIEFYPNSHRYKLAGEKTYLISATGATGIIDKSQVLIPWALGLARTHLLSFFEKSEGNSFTSEELIPVIEEALKRHQVVKDEAAGIGTAVHDWIEQFVLAKMNGTEMPLIPEDEFIRKGINGFVEWYLAQESVEFIKPERLVYSRTHQNVGKTDMLARVNGILTVFDWKTGKGVYPEFWIQLSSYWKAIEEEDDCVIEQGTLLHLDKETGEFTAHTISREEVDEHFEAFKALLVVKNWQKKNATYKKPE